MVYLSAKFLQCPLLDTGHITAADARLLRHLPLSVGRIAPQPIAQLHHQPFLFRQTFRDSLPQCRDPLPGADGFQQVLIPADHIHQRKCRSIRPRFDIIRQRYILRTLFLRSKMHQYLVFHTPGGISGQPCPLGCIKCSDSFYQPNRSNGDQVLLIRSLCVVFLGGLMPAEFF